MKLLLQTKIKQLLSIILNFLWKNIDLHQQSVRILLYCLFEFINIYLFILLIIENKENWTDYVIKTIANQYITHLRKENSKSESDKKERSKFNRRANRIQLVIYFYFIFLQQHIPLECANKTI